MRLMNLLRIVFMGVLFLAAGIFIGCDKEIKEAARPAALKSAYAS